MEKETKQVETNAIQEQLQQQIQAQQTYIQQLELTIRVLSNLMNK